MSRPEFIQDVYDKNAQLKLVPLDAYVTPAIDKLTTCFEVVIIDTIRLKSRSNSIIVKVAIVSGSSSPGNVPSSFVLKIFDPWVLEGKEGVTNSTSEAQALYESESFAYKCFQECDVAVRKYVLNCYFFGEFTITASSYQVKCGVIGLEYCGWLRPSESKAVMGDVDAFKEKLREAMKAIHLNRFAHGDLTTPGNIKVSSNNPDYLIKILDWGDSVSPMYRLEEYWTTRGGDETAIIKFEVT